MGTKCRQAIQNEHLLKIGALNYKACSPPPPLHEFALFAGCDINYFSPSCCLLFVISDRYSYEKMHTASSGTADLSTRHHIRLSLNMLAHDGICAEMSPSRRTMPYAYNLAHRATLFIKSFHVP